VGGTPVDRTAREGEATPGGRKEHPPRFPFSLREEDPVRPTWRRLPDPAARASGAYTRLTIGVERRRRGQERRKEMILATTKVEDFDRFLNTFSTKGAEKRKQHGSKGSHVFRDPNEDDRVWVLFDWDVEGWQSFVSDPEVPPILQEAGHKGKPQPAELGGQYDA
jgi:hypothetical protein